MDSLEEKAKVFAKQYYQLPESKVETVRINSAIRFAHRFAEQVTGSSLFQLEKQRLEWSLKTFDEATPISSLRKLESEIKEIESDILAGKKEPEEYADALMCLLDSAGRQGIQLEDILSAYASKFERNKNRVWKKNPDNSYSHVKI